MSKLNIIFMGTPEFAVPSLKLLSEQNIYNIKAVYTQPDKPVGRKQILTAPPVKKLAMELGIPVFQPAKIRKNETVREHLESLDLDLIIVVAYGKILPESILNIPKKSCINVHGSILEKYRGAAPIQWSIANGESVTGNTIMLMDKGMDTGDILKIGELKIELTDDTLSLSEKMSIHGAELLIETVPKYVSGEIKPRKQDNEKATYAPMIKKNDGLINWNNSASQIFNQVRAFRMWPSVFTYFKNNQVKITECSPLIEKSDYKSGQIISFDKSGIRVGTGNGTLLLTRVKPSGSKEMNAYDFANGKRLEPGFFFENSNLC